MFLRIEVNFDHSNNLNFLNILLFHLFLIYSIVGTIYIVKYYSI